MRRNYMVYSGVQREKMRQEVESLLAADATSLEDVFALESQEKQDEIMN